MSNSEENSLLVFDVYYNFNTSNGDIPTGGQPMKMSVEAYDSSDAYDRVSQQLASNGFKVIHVKVNEDDKDGG